MAYKVIIADDDAMIRRGLSCLIPWQQLGFELLECFEDGKQVIEYLHNHAVDVILTDIHMHDVSGLDIAQYVCEAALPTKVVVLSGYQEFDYAQRAIRYNVTEYLLKPIAIDDLKDVFARIREQLDQEQTEKAQRAQIEGNLKQLQDRIDRLFLMDAYLGKLASEGEYLQRVHSNGYRQQDLQRKSVLLDIVCAAGKEATVISGMNLIDDGCSFYVLKQREEMIEGLLMANEPDALDCLTAQVIEQRLLALGSIQVRCYQMAAFGDLRQFTQFQRPEINAAGGPAAQAEQYLRQNYARDITLNDVAAHIFVSPVYLSRVFHQKMGRTFTEALTMIRLEAAKRMLTESNEAVSDIARKCGYTDSKYFYKQFKRYIGVSPGMWRQTCIKKDDIDA